MKAFAAIAAAGCVLILTGCANRQGVTPSQNPTLQALSPNTNATSEGGVMQRSLDTWLKEDWEPLTAPKPAPAAATPAGSAATPAGSAATPASPAATPSSPTKASASQAPAAEPVTPAAQPAPAPTPAESTTAETADDEPFTLQKYVDKWKAYNDNKPASQEPSHTEKLNSLPAIGK